YGHGSEALTDKPFRIEEFAEQVLAFLHERNLEKVSVFGYSMGGYLALYLACRHPEKINRIFTLATKFDWTEECAAKEVKMLDPDKIEAKVPAFASELSDRHGAPYWKNVLHKTAAMMQELGRKPILSPADLSRIEVPVLISVGDRDVMVSLEETANAYKQLQNAALLVLPQTAHPLEKVEVGRLVFECRRFFG
ncbi:MAG TPA: alpha/beta fold hydrolase, partial [Adhaeribacter sp.]|nr:alpha/beta fold hydrolase [Adhaeribacter sp.]